MKTEDSFMRRMCRLNKMAELMERKMQFSPPNNKTLGIMVVCSCLPFLASFCVLDRPDFVGVHCLAALANWFVCICSALV